MRFRRQQPDPSGAQDRYNGLPGSGYHLLASYNSEKGRGVTHTPQWQAEMARLQARWDAGERERLIREGWTELPGGGWIKSGG